MDTAGLVVVGASLAGLRAVEAARLIGYTGPITLIGAEPHLPYDRPPLSKEFLDGPEEPETPYFRTEDSLRVDLGVDLRLGAPATALDPDGRTVTVARTPIRYDALVLATGAAARPLPGTAGMAGMHTLRGLDDARAIRSALVPGTRMVIVGAGFIGTEIACAARRRGVAATVVEAAPAPLLRAVGAEFGPVLGDVLRRHGVDLRCGGPVADLVGEERVRAVRLADGTELPADLVVVGLGAVPATDWLADSGLKLDDGVVCDETLSTAVDSVYAAGDVARWFNPTFGQVMRLENWTTAAEQATVAARNAVDPDGRRSCATVPYFWSDWNGDRVQFVGLPAGEETAFVRGGPDTDAFLALYRRGDRVIGALGLNQRRAVIRLRSAIGRGAGWDETVAALRD
ncbi:FAD-dependent oxidoreductase [Micromonospora inaquosa]|uniref:FAD-dependent oxidoreductase n=1 Tax=Micromonospora inaquosa TaxID=2203716 RepID=A0A3N9WM12_9ACTN|nr:FAD-dependent oxidoreductase [Micromonospora inaquosa]RQX01790.1 FAD-dependent oxidoreductase [Micromonospora inaquosa]